LFDRLLRRVQASSTPQREYPLLGPLLRTLYLSRRVFDHLRFMDFSIIPGWSGYVAWRLGLVRMWQNRFVARRPRPPKKKSGARALIPVDSVEAAEA
jgi:hypothetical protein